MNETLLEESLYDFLDWLAEESHKELQRKGAML